MIQYVCGFLFDTDYDRVVLIRKNRPDWQAGKLNGVGGHLEEDESLCEAMSREFREETGIDTSPMDWDFFCTIDNLERGSMCHFARAVAPYDTLMLAKSMTDEIVEVFPLTHLQSQVMMDNLKWLIPMAADEKVQDSRVDYE